MTLWKIYCCLSRGYAFTDPVTLCLVLLLFFYFDVCFPMFLASLLMALSRLCRPLSLDWTVKIVVFLFQLIVCMCVLLVNWSIKFGGCVGGFVRGALLDTRAPLPSFHVLYIPLLFAFPLTLLRKEHRAPKARVQKIKKVSWTFVSLVIFCNLLLSNTGTFSLLQLPVATYSILG